MESIQDILDIDLKKIQYQVLYGLHCFVFLMSYFVIYRRK